MSKQSTLTIGFLCLQYARYSLKNNNTYLFILLTDDSFHSLPSLLTELRQFQQELHRPPPLPEKRDVLVTNGAQHGIYQCVELLVNEGDPVLTTEYSYTGIHSAVGLLTYIHTQLHALTLAG